MAVLCEILNDECKNLLETLISYHEAYDTSDILIGFYHMGANSECIFKWLSAFYIKKYKIPK